MHCSQCGFENLPSMKFCVDCGHKMLIRCAQCSTEMLPSYKFCGECGQPLTAGTASVSASAPAAATSPARSPYAAAPQAQAPPPAAADQASPVAPSSLEGERKQVTVLFCDLAAGSEIAQSADVLHEVLSEFFAFAQAEVEKYGGSVSRFLGQGFMALFGAAMAHEDHPRRGILAAQGIRRHLLSEAKLAAGWTARMGIDTGTVVVGGIGGMAVGEATKTAALLQQHASAGEILVSDTTYRLVRGQIQLAGHTPLEDAETDSRLEVWSATEEADVGILSHFAQEGVSPFIGRERELMVLEQLRDQSREGRGQVVAVTGEAGSGKSRLLHELYRRTFPSKQGTSYLRGQCVSYGSGVPYLPLIDMVRKASRITDSDDPTVVKQKLAGSLHAVGTDAAETLPFLLRFLGIREGTESLDELEPQAIQARTFAAMRRMLLDAASKSLVVLEIEDLQWIDATSAEFLDSLIEVMAPARMMVLLTYRSGYQPKWLEKSYATLLNTGPLSNEESGDLVAALLERADFEGEPPGGILDKAEGNPFFLEEMARAVIESSADEGDSVPDTVQGILMARIDRLPDEHKRLLRTSSVLGRELSLELLEEIWDQPDSLEAQLDDLQRWELIYKAPSEDRVTYFFRQALTQEVVYQSLLETRREALHRRVAETLEKLYEGRLEDAYDRLIYHYPKAGQPTKTVFYLVQFAAQAAEGYAHAEAAQALRESLVQVELLPEEERERRLIEVMLQLAESLLPLAAFPETLELFQEHLERMETLEDPSLAGLYYFWLAHTFTYLGLQEETREYADKAIDAARNCKDETTEGKARYVLGRDGFWSGQFQSGIENSLRAVVLLERNGEPWWQGQAYWVAGFNHYVLGQFEEAIDALERAFALGEALDDYRLDTSWSLGHFYASLGEAATGIEQCRRGLERAQDPLNSAVSMGFLGHALLQQGTDLPKSAEYLKQASELMAGAGMQQLEGWFSAILGDALLESGDIEAARAAAERGLEASREAKFWYGVGLAQKSLGRVALGAGEVEAARGSLEEARSRFVDLQVPFEIARIDLELGRLARFEDDTQAMSESFQRARAGFEELQVPYWVERVDEAAA